MIGEPNSVRNALKLFVDPVTPEKRALLAQRWATLDPAVKMTTQGLGQKATGCGATIGIQPKCDFACTGCYLGSEANKIPGMPMEAIFAQLRQLRAYLGPKSNVQITDGEVTLRPVDELVAILRYARSIGIVPMVMTHGDNLRRKPGLLETLMSDGFLTEISIHIDITQRGRDGYRSPKTEAELMPLRDEFAEMVRAARRKTGRRLRAATTMTITSQNLREVSDIVRWTVKNRDAFSLISFQPLAQVGRTRKTLEGVSAQLLWAEIGKATGEYGLPLTNAEPMHFGHPDCTRFVPLIAMQPKGADSPKLMQLIRDTPEDIQIMKEYTDQGLLGMAFRDDRPVELTGRALGAFRRAPTFLFGKAWRWVSSRLKQETGRSLIPTLFDGLTGKTRVDGVTLTSHHFMAPEELPTEVGQARLAACVFRLPFKGEMIPMCQMNAGGTRDEFYDGIMKGEQVV